MLMPDNTQNNILITQDGRACLGEFGITGSFECFEFEVYELTTLRYMAPECLLFGSEEPSKHSIEGDVYSFAMTSFSVRSYSANYPPPKYNPPLMVRSSRVYCHMTAATTTRSTRMSKAVCGRPAQRTQVGINGCGTLLGT